MILWTECLDNLDFVGTEAQVMLQYSPHIGPVLRCKAWLTFDNFFPLLVAPVLNFLASGWFFHHRDDVSFESGQLCFQSFPTKFRVSGSSPEFSTTWAVPTSSRWNRWVWLPRPVFNWIRKFKNTLDRCIKHKRQSSDDYYINPIWTYTECRYSFFVNSSRSSTRR